MIIQNEIVKHAWSTFPIHLMEGAVVLKFN